MNFLGTRVFNHLVIGVSSCFPMSDPPYPIMRWNVHGMNIPAKCVVVCKIIASQKVAILCLQETIINVWSGSLVREVEGACTTTCIVLPDIGSSGGDVIFWNKDVAIIVSHALLRP